MTLRKQNFKPGNLICLSKAGQDFYGFKDSPQPAILMLLVKYDSDNNLWLVIKEEQLSYGWYLEVKHWEVLS